MRILPATSFLLAISVISPGATAGLAATRQDVTRARLTTAARSGGDYLLRMQRPDGSFHYYYNAAEDRFEQRTYNMVRHAGTALSLLELYSSTRDIRYLDAGRRAARFLETRFHPVPGRDAMYVLDYDRKAKLGANGLALVALTKLLALDPKSNARATSQRLANLILMLQRKDGSFHTRYRLQPNDPAGIASLYYPGEAILGLARLYDVTRDKRLLVAARRGADFLIASQRAMRTLPADAWLMQALEALYNIGHEKHYAEHALALAGAMISEQYTDEDSDGYAGGFGPGPPRVTPAASRAEGLVAAYRLARSSGDARASSIAAALKASARFQLTQQFTSENNASARNPARAAGGFFEGSTEPFVRIDFVQHNISSLLGIAETLY